MTKKLKIIFSIIAWCVLIYYIINYNNYDTLLQTLSQSIYNGWRWGLIAILLCPLNWYLEAKKWQTITKKLQPLTTKKAILSILNGIVVAFFTPNRIGEMPARCLDLEEGNRVRGLSLGIISSISQTLVIGLWGIPALILFIQILQNHKISLLFPILIILIILLTYCLLPSIINFFSKKKNTPSWFQYIQPIGELNGEELFKIMIIASLRYFVFCFQYYLFLKFFGIDLNIKNAFILIATNYLFLTFTPSIAYSEGITRASIAIVVFSTVTKNTIAIGITGITIWIINFIIPMIVGSLLPFIKEKSSKQTLYHE